MTRILSGIQPTGRLHLGNYLGAIKNWVKLQDDYECLFCIVDLHALSNRHSAKLLTKNIRMTAATYIACGLSPEKNIIFNQSKVFGHAHLGWILGCQTPMGWLNRMTQFKDKAGKNHEKASLGLYSYPVLQAADILLYKATHVPVGEDQKQHLELARDIAVSFNKAYFRDFFPLPIPQIIGHATRVMSLRNGSKKMSKSDLSDNSRIHLSDDKDTIYSKIRKAKTDSKPLAGMIEDMKSRPEAMNLINIFAGLADYEPKIVCQNYDGSSFSTFKKDLTDLIIEKIIPIGDEIKYLMKDTDAIDTILEQGAEKSIIIATKTISEVHSLLGLL